MIVDTHYRFLLFLCHIWAIKLHQMFTMRQQPLKRKRLQKETFVKLPDRFIKRMLKQGNKHRSMIPMLNQKIWQTSHCFQCF